MASAPAFAATPRLAVAAIATANTGRNGTGTVGTIFTAGSNGSRIETIRIEATVTTTAGMIRLFIYTGSAYFLWKEIDVSAITPSATLKAFTAVIDCGDSQHENMLVLPTGYSLRASTHNAEKFNVFVVGGDF